MDVAELSATLGIKIDASAWSRASEAINKIADHLGNAGRAGKKAGEEGAEGWEKFGEMMETVNHLLETYLGYEGLKTIGEMTEQVVSQTMNLQHLSERYGVSIQQMQSFDYMAKLTGTSIEGVTNAMTRMEFGLHAMRGASGGMRGALLALRQLGISADEFRKSNMQQQLGLLADKFEKMADPNQKIAMAMQLGGREMVALIPLLSKGRDKIAELTEEAKKYGATLDPEQAEAYEEQQAKLRLQWDGIKVQIVSLLLPALQKLGDWLSKVMSYFREHPEQLKHALEAITVVAGTVTVALGALAARTIVSKLAFGELLGTLGPFIAILTATYEAAEWINGKLGRTPAILTAVTGAVLALAVALRQLRGGNSILGSVAKKLLGLGGKKLLGGAAGAAEEGIIGEGAAESGFAAEAAGAAVGESAGAAIAASLVPLLAPFAVGLAAVGGAAALMQPDRGTPTRANTFGGLNFGTDEESMRRWLTPEDAAALKQTSGGREFLKKVGYDIHISAPVTIHTEASAEDIKAAIDEHHDDLIRTAKKNMDAAE